MTFASLPFIFCFIPAFMLIYYIFPFKKRGTILLLGSLVYYGLNSWEYLILLVVSVLFNYLCSYRIYINFNYDDNLSARFLRRRRAWLIVAIIYNIGVLGTFKYLPCNLILPLGISFYTFQMLSFVIDMYNEKYEDGVSLLHFATYAVMFPQIGSGPITRYTDIAKDIEKPHNTKPKMLEQGIMTFIIGLSYKALLADKIAALWNDVYRVGAYGMDVATAWLGAWGYSMELYFDFFGYSLMAIGIAMMLGIKLPDNFDEPYSSKTMTTFWRRWHMTLGQWFRDYLYIPLGGNRKGKVRVVLNIFIVWMLTAIWHGSTINFAIWGLFLFFILFLEKTFYGKWMDNTKVLGHIYMIILIPVSWIIFAISNPTVLLEYLMRMVNIPLDGMVVNGFSKFISLIEMYWWLILLCIFFATPYPMKVVKKYHKKLPLKVLLFIAFWVSIYELHVTGNNPFIYFSF